MRRKARKDNDCRVPTPSAAPREIVNEEPTRWQTPVVPVISNTRSNIQYGNTGVIRQYFEKGTVKNIG